MAAIRKVHRKKTQRSHISLTPVHTLLVKMSTYLEVDLVYFLKNSLFTFTGQIALTIIGFLLSIVLTRTLSKGDYGGYLFVLSAMNILSITCVVGLGPAILNSVSNGYKKALLQGVEYSKKYARLGVLAIICIASYFLFTKNILLAALFIIAIPFLYSNYVFNSHIYFFLGLRRFDKSTLNLTLIRLSASVAAIILALITREVLLVFAGYVAFHFLFTFIGYWDAKRQISAKDKEDPDLIHFGGKLTLYGTIIEMIVVNIDKVLTGVLIGLENLSLYAVGIMLPENVLPFLDSMLVSVLPKLSVKNSGLTYRSLVKKTLILIMFTIPVAILVGVLCWYLVPLLFPLYPNAVWISLVFCGLLILRPPYYVLKHVMIQRKLLTTLLHYELLTAPLYLLLLFLLGWFYGMWGIIAAVCINRVNSLITCFVLLRNKI